MAQTRAETTELPTLGGGGGGSEGGGPRAPSPAAEASQKRAAATVFARCAPGHYSCSSCFALRFTVTAGSRRDSAW